MAFINENAIAIVYPEALRERVGRETLIVTGSPRGGTSALAFALREAGFFLGDRLGAKVHEDRDFLEAFQAEPARKRQKALAALAAARNATHGRWGFKLPIAACHLGEFAALARDPVAVVVYRNPLAVGRSIVARGPNFPQGNDGLLKAVTLASERMMMATRQLLDTKTPALLIDFDRFREAPGANLAFFFTTLQVSVSPEDLDRLAATLAEPGYKRASGKA